MLGLGGIVKQAVREAKKSTHFIRLGCVIFKGKSIIAVGYNKASHNTKGIPQKYLKWEGSLHAEMMAILNALDHDRNLAGASLLVVRINNQDQFRFARPCKYCMTAITELTPIKKIYFSIDHYPYLERIKY